MRARHFAMILASICALAAVPAGARDVYKWTDENGKVHYGDRPAAATSQKLDLQRAPPPDADTANRAARTRKLLDVISEERAEAQQLEATRREEAATRKANCEQASALLEEYRTASYLYQDGDDGEPLVLSKEERSAAESQAQKAVDHWCKPQG